MPENYYEILGVERDCDFKTLKKAYYRRAKECHPDRHHNSSLMEEEFKRVAEAFNILSDPEKRHRFDRAEELRATAIPPATAEGKTATSSIMDTPGDDDLEELITGNTVPRDTTLANLLRDLAGTDVFIKFREGKNLFFHQRYRAARVSFLQAVEHSPNNIVYRVFLARSCVMVNDFVGALHEYQIALELGARRIPAQEMRLVHRELDQLQEKHSPWWYRVYRKFFPVRDDRSGDTRQAMIDETNRAIAHIAAERQRQTKDTEKERKRLNR